MPDGHDKAKNPRCVRAGHLGGLASGAARRARRRALEVLVQPHAADESSQLKVEVPAGADGPAPQAPRPHPACSAGCERTADCQGLCALCYDRARQRAHMVGLWQGRWSPLFAALAYQKPRIGRTGDACAACQRKPPGLVLIGAVCVACYAGSTDAARTPHARSVPAASVLPTTRPDDAPPLNWDTVPPEPPSDRGAQGDDATFDLGRLTMLEACLGALGPALATSPMLRTLLHDELPALIRAHRATLQGGSHA